jgi:hypothetical protein
MERVYKPRKMGDGSRSRQILVHIEEIRNDDQEVLVYIDATKATGGDAMSRTV